VSGLLRGETDAAEQAWLGAHLDRLRHRTFALDASVVLGAIGGAFTCGAAFILLLGSLRDTVIATWLYTLFGLVLGCTACALVAFMADSVLAWRPLPHPKS
jgi:hypothetical protein